MDLDPSTQALGIRLGLGDLNHRNPCSSYAAGCVCSECQQRAEDVNPAFLRWLEADGPELMPRLLRRPTRVGLPWEIDSALRAA